MKEAAVKTAIKRALVDNGLYYFMPPGAGYGRAGIPDFVGCAHGTFFAIEAKGEGGKTTALQERELQFIRDNRGIAVVITHEDNIPTAIASIAKLALDRAKGEMK
jgi:hypothetical protein